MYPNRCMHDLHRLYWAIRSNRPRLATVLMTRCSQPILAGIFSAQIYRHQILPTDYVPDAKLKPKYLPSQMRAMSEAYACEILDNAEFDGSNAAFDSFIFYGADEEEDDDYIDFVTKEADQIDNTNVRSVLQLVGVDEKTEVTHIDLALLANSKKFMTQNGVMQFLEKLWTRPSDNGNWVQRHLPQKLQVPRIKMMVNLYGFVAFLIAYIYMLRSVPARGEEFVLTNYEIAFWCWAQTFMLNEVVEALGDFDTFLDYIRGQGNLIDCAVILLFLIAMITRIVSLVQYQEDTYRVRIETLNVHVALDAVDIMYCVLSGNLVLCCFRFLLLCSISERIGVMVIIVGKIVQRDIWPFAVFAATAIVAFEAAGIFFSWVMGMKHVFGYFFQQFTGRWNLNESSTCVLIGWAAC